MIDAFTDVAAAAGWAGARALDPDGRKVGDVVGLLVDRQEGRPRWLLVTIGRGRGCRCVPLADTIGRADRVHVPRAARVVRGSPPVPGDGGLSARLEHDLCRYYRLPASRLAAPPTWDRRRTTALAVRADDGTLTWEPGPRDRTPPPAAAPRAWAWTAASPVRPPDPPASAWPAPPAWATIAPSERRVLIVEPDPVAVVRLAEAIDREPGFCVRAVVRDGPPALTAARTIRPDVVVSALQLPLLGGLELRARLQAHHPDLRIVLLDHATISTHQRLDARTVLVSAPADPAAVLRALAEVVAPVRQARAAPA